MPYTVTLTYFGLIRLICLEVTHKLLSNELRDKPSEPSDRGYCTGDKGWLCR